MKAKEVHTLNDEELKIEEGNLRQQLFTLRSQAVTEKLENPRQLRNLRRDIARVLTEQSARKQKKA
ncbi:MAG: 50S ribosomal protein L29 [Phycisphaera sp.]|nr:50S ribosomal protein L29 [Phycisphaera sp.]